MTSEVTEAVRAWSVVLPDRAPSDHWPCSADLGNVETDDFGTACGGIASAQLGLPAVWTQARQLGHSLSDVVRWMGENPVDAVGHDGRGRIAAGAGADFAVIAPDEEFDVKKEDLYKNVVSPYDGRRLVGVARGSRLADEHMDLDAPRHGRELSRN